MSKLNQLDFIFHLYSGNAKVARIPCNFLLHDSIEEILRNFQSREKHWIYTSFEVEYQGSIIKRGSLTA
jgi:hypothetical protein